MKHRRDKYYENIEYEKARAKRYHETHKEERSIKRRESYKTTKERENAQAREWYLNNKDKHLKDGNKWRKKNPDKARLALERYRARKVNAGGDYTEKDIKRQYYRQRGECFYCVNSIKEKYHVEHVVPLSRGGTNYCGNIVLTCPSCNTSKGNKYITEWKNVS